MTDHGESRAMVRRRRDDIPPEHLLKSPMGKVPPHDLDAEAALLSACMSRGVEAVDEALPHVSAEDLYSEAHRQIFEACVDLAQRHQPVDLVQIATWLKERERLMQVGGTPYLMQVSDAAPVVTEAHLVAYARTIRNRARLRRLAVKLAGAHARCFASMPDAETEGFFSDIERDIGEIVASTNTSDLVPIGPITMAVMKKFEEHEKSGGGIVGISTGFDRFDRQTGGLHDGDLTIIAARPGLGKTSLVMGICDNVSDVGYAGAIFSLEMPKEQLVSRLLCTRARVDLSKARLGTFHASDWQKLSLASSQVFPKDIYIDDQADQTFAMIRSKVRRLKAKLLRKKKRLGVVIIDYLQLMRTRTGRDGKTHAQLIGEITRGLKKLAKELSIPIVILCQLNRDVEKRDDKRPVISDLRDSGEIEQDADNIIFIYRDDYYFRDTEEPNVAELIIAKQRNGPTGVVKLRFDKQWTRFDNITEGEYVDHPTTDGEPYVRGEFYAQQRDLEPPSGRFDDDDAGPETQTRGTR